MGVGGRARPGPRGVTGDVAAGSGRRSHRARRRAAVVGSGPNGLAAAIVLAAAGVEVVVHEAAERPGGGLRSEALTLPGVVHDVCATAVPLVGVSPFFRRFRPEALGVELRHPPAPLAHPFDDGTAVVVVRGTACRAIDVGAGDVAWRRRFHPLVGSLTVVADELLGPVRLPRHPGVAARLAVHGVPPATVLAASFGSERAAAVFCGLAAHSLASLRRPGTAVVGLLLGALAHGYGWPFVAGGSQLLADALVARLHDLGGEVRCGSAVDDVDALDADVVLLDCVPREVLRIAGHRLSATYRRRLAAYRHGPGAFKVDWALSGPIPWRASGCHGAGVVHLGGSAAEIVAAEEAVARGEVAPRPFVLLAQPTVADPTRAPRGIHVAWAYCHLPSGSAADLTAAVEAQVERFAPGFGERVVGRSVMGPAQLEAHDRNLVGGDVGAGSAAGLRLLFRPMVRLDPYATSDPRLFLCSAATPPGGGVHGLCGLHAARSGLRRLGG